RRARGRRGLAPPPNRSLAAPLGRLPVTAVVADRRRHVFRIVVGVAIVAVGAMVGWHQFSWSDPTIPWPTHLPACDGFDFRVGPPDAVGYHDDQPFGQHEHLGNDWNGNGGGDTDLGDPVHAAAAGVVIEATDIGGDWGNVVRVAHGCGVESLYAHLDRI